MSTSPCHVEHTTGFTGKRLGRNDPDGSWEPCDEYDLERRLCDDEGWVTEDLVAEATAAPGLTYLQQTNNLRAHTGLRPVDRPFHCTGSAHLAAAHIRCTTPIHARCPGCEDRTDIPLRCSFCGRAPSQNNGADDA